VMFLASRHIQLYIARLAQFRHEADDAGIPWTIGERVFSPTHFDDDLVAAQTECYAGTRSL
jgi:hypothetical protein